MCRSSEKLPVCKKFLTNLCLPKISDIDIMRPSKQRGMTVAADYKEFNSSSRRGNVMNIKIFCPPLCWSSASLPLKRLLPKCASSKTQAAPPPTVPQSNGCSIKPCSPFLWTAKQKISESWKKSNSPLNDFVSPKAGSYRRRAARHLSLSFRTRRLCTVLPLASFILGKAVWKIFSDGLSRYKGSQRKHHTQAAGSKG